MTDSTYYGQYPVPGTATVTGAPVVMNDVPDPAPVPAAPAWVSQPAEVTAPAPAPDPATPPEAPAAQAGSPETGSEPAPEMVPPVGSLARYTVHDVYASPAHEREAVVVVTGHDTAPDGSVRVRGFVLGYADAAASFLPGELTTG